MPRVFVHEFVTGGGLAEGTLPPSWAAEGAAMRRTAAADFAAVPGVEVVVTLDRRLGDEPGPWSVVRVGPREEVATFTRLADEADYTLVIAPETEGVLTDRASLLIDRRGRPLGCSVAAIELTGEKLLLERHFARKGLETIPSLLVFDADRRPADGDFPYPAVLKPFDGAGSIATFLIRNADDWPAEALSSLPALLQPRLPGEPMSASFIVAEGGRPILVGVARQRMAVRRGQFCYLGGTVPGGPTGLADAASEALGTVPGLRGWVGVDFVWDEAEGRVVLLEINPRLTTSYVGFVRLAGPGTIARLWLDAMGGEVGPEAQGLARRLEGCPPLTFDADGAVAREEPA